MPADSPENWRQIADTIKDTLGGRDTAEGIQVHCPCHEDKTASLSIRISEDGLLWHCKANCDGKEIVKALQKQGLYPSRAGRKKHAKVNGKREIEDVYNYPGGVQKVRYVGKDFVIRKTDASGFTYKTPLKDWKRQLYLSPWLEQAIASDSVILLCEGEKDCKNFLALKIPGYFATTNIEGGGNWRREYNAQLNGARVVICEDNDEVGQARTLKIGADLQSKCAVRVWKFTEFGNHGDLSDYLEKYPVASREELDAVIQALTVPFQISDYTQKAPHPGLSQDAAQPQPPVVDVITQSPADEKQPSKKRIPSATREDYYDLFERVLGPLPRDIFSGKCMMRRGTLWVSAWNYLDLVKSEADFLEGAKVRKYKQTVIEPHFAAYEHHKEEILIPEIPTWDGKDRIKLCADCCILDGSQKFPAQIVEHYFKGWLAGIFQKLTNPRHQNPVLILRSEKQGIGKDWLVNALTDGLEQWAKNMNFTNNDRDNYLQLSRAAVMKIAEFDRTSKAEMSTLKDMIFRDTTYLRASHERELEDRICKASFVATVNPEDFYRDATGHRRYAVFNLAEIKYNYPRSIADSKQVIAQAQALANSSYEIPRMHQVAMAEFLKTKAPQSDAEFIAEHWSAIAEQYAASNIEITARGWITNAEATTGGLFERLTKITGFRLKTCQNLLKNSGLGMIQRAAGSVARGYRWLDDDEIEKNAFETDQEGGVTGLIHIGNGDKELDPL